MVAARALLLLRDVLTRAPAVSVGKARGDGEIDVEDRPGSCLNHLCRALDCHRRCEQPRSHGAHGRDDCLRSPTEPRTATASATPGSCRPRALDERFSTNAVAGATTTRADRNGDIVSYGGGCPLLNSASVVVCLASELRPSKGRPTTHAGCPPRPAAAGRRGRHQRRGARGQPRRSAPGCLGG
jgi:hypothetical protein